MKINNIFQSILVLLSLAGLFHACSLLEKKKEETPNPEEQINTDTLALKTGRGFSTLAIISSQYDGSTGAGGGFSDGIELMDMTLDADGKTLHITANSILTTQQDPLYAKAHYALDIFSRSLGPGLPNGLSQYAKGAFYQPGSAKMFIPDLSCNNFGICTGSLTGDFSYQRTYTFASRPTVTQEGEIIETGRNDSYASWAPTWRVRLYSAMRTLSNQSYTMETQYTVPSRSDYIGSFALEPKTTNNPTVWVIGTSEKKIYVGEVTMTSDISLTPILFVDSMNHEGGFSGSGISVKVKPNADRSSFAIYCQKTETEGDRIATYTFNPTTKKLAANISNLKIPSLGQGMIDTDFDLSGNVYFDGWANNFKSDSTISIYKASGNEIRSIGEDILRSGSIKAIRCFDGKVFAAHVYAYRKNLSSANASKYYRIGILKMD